MIEGLDIAPLTVWREARGEPFMDKMAVAWVIKNRADHPRWWGDDVRSVCLKHNGNGVHQFSCFNDGDPNSRLLPGDRDVSWIDAQDAWRFVSGGRLPDFTLSADHYHTLSVQPYWSAPRIGDDGRAIPAPEPTYVGRRMKFFRLELKDDWG